MTSCSTPPKGFFTRCGKIAFPLVEGIFTQCGSRLIWLSAPRALPRRSSQADARCYAMQSSCKTCEDTLLHERHAEAMCRSVRLVDILHFLPLLTFCSCAGSASNRMHSSSWQVHKLPLLTRSCTHSQCACTSELHSGASLCSYTS